jgi:hypothetical protein
MMDVVSSLPVAIQAVADSLKGAIDTVNAYKARQRAIEEKNWASVLDLSATVKKLVAEHLESVRIITAPARMKGPVPFKKVNRHL